MTDSYGILHVAWRIFKILVGNTVLSNFTELVTNGTGIKNSLKIKKKSSKCDMAYERN